MMKLVPLICVVASSLARAGDGFPSGPTETAAMRYGSEQIVRKLQRAARMRPESVLFEYLHNAGGVDFSCDRGPIPGAIPVISTDCDGEGVLALAGRPAYSLLSSGPRGEDRLAFVLAHELVHIKQGDVPARLAKIDALHAQWVERRLTFFHARRREFPEQVERMEADWRGDDQWWNSFNRDLFGRTPATERPSGAFMTEDKRIAQWLQNEFDMFLARQENKADEDACKIMACAGYDPLESGNAVMPLGHIVWWMTGEKTDPRTYGTFSARAQHVLDGAILSRCACPEPIPVDAPAPPRSTGARRR